MIIKEDLRVEGWLEAPNIRPFLKGLFASVESLMATYPRPLAGWAALVGTSLPAPLYVAAEGRWQATGDTAGAILTTADNSLTPLSPLSPSLLPLSPPPFGEEDEEIAPEFAIGHYIPQQNGIEDKAGFRISASFPLQPGDILEVTCDTGGEAWPIAIVAPYEAGNWFDLPPLGDMGKGARTYRYHAEAEVRARISCFGPAEKMVIRRNALPFLSTDLRSVNGVRMSCSRTSVGAALRADETTAEVHGYGVSDLLPLGSVRFLKYEGYAQAEEGETIAFLIFYNDDGVMMQTHYVGADAAGTRHVRHSAGEIKKVIAVPGGATHVRACSRLMPSSPYVLKSR